MADIQIDSRQTVTKCGYDKHASTEPYIYSGISKLIR